MSATFKELSDRIGQVGELYARVHNIPRCADWYLLKLTEELGELTAEHLLIGGRAKPNADGSGGTREALEKEAADCSANSSCICAKMISTSKPPSSASGFGILISMLNSTGLLQPTGSDICGAKSRPRPWQGCTNCGHCGRRRTAYSAKLQKSEKQVSLYRDFRDSRRSGDCTICFP